MEQDELLEQAERGRKANIAAEFLNEYFLQERALLLNKLETDGDFSYDAVLALKISLRVLRNVENWLKSIIDNGEIAEKEIDENGK